jgi:integrase
MATIQKRGKSYYFTVSCGYDTKGNQVRKTKTWMPDSVLTPKQLEKELQRQVILFEEQVKTGQSADGNIKFADFIDKWITEHCEKQLQPKTISENKKLLKRIIPTLGHIRLDKLKPLHFQQFYNNLQEPGMNEKTGGFLSANTISHYHRLLSSMLNTAVLWGMIPNNPLKIKPPKIEAKESSYLDDEQAVKLLDALDTESIVYRTMITLLLYTGARKGEVLGLEWKDIDFDNSLLSIVRSSQYISKQGIITKEPKNKNSIRSIKVSGDIIALLQQYKKWQEEERLKCGDRWNDTDRLFTQWNGTPMHPDTLPTWFDKFLKRHGLPDINIHGLRHTCASILIAQRVDIRTVSKRLGHAQPSTTSNIYSHQIRSADEAASDVLSLALNRKKNIES